MLSTIDSIEEKVDGINGGLENYVQTHELEGAQTEMNGRHDQLQSGFTALGDRAAASKEATDNFKDLKRLVELETADHLVNDSGADNMVAVRQIATGSQAVAQAVVDRVYIRCTRLHNRQAAQQVVQAPQQQHYIWGI